MIDFIKTKRLYIIALALMFAFVTLSDTTYSLFLSSNKTDEFSYNTGLLDLEYIEDEPIVLENVFPTNDSVGSNLKPYIFTIKNIGSFAYLFNLQMVSSDPDNTIDYKYIKVKLNDKLPMNLSLNNNIIASNILIEPNEEISFKINIWLDTNTPNTELGKTFKAKIITSGNAVYKTIDKSGANFPKLKDNMIPVYYDNTNNTWKIADKSNIDESNTWYNYNNKMWANSITLKSSKRKIYDITRTNDIEVDNLTINNGNVIIDNKYLDLGIANYNYNSLTNIFRIKFNSLEDKTISIISNGNITYYYDTYSHRFYLSNGNETVKSNAVSIEADKWYIIGYSYDNKKVTFYADGANIGSNNLTGNIKSNNTFKLGTDNTTKKLSKITVGDILFYNRILKDSEISSNYHTSINIVRDGLISGYSEFTPMTLKEYYLSKNNGFDINYDDVSSHFVWIPRYRYRLWNVTGDNNIDSYDAKNKGIDVVFENGTNSSGTIYCDNDKCYSDKDKTISVNTGDNDKYYTHSAFTNQTEELTGFWVSKYELSNNNQVESKFNLPIWTNSSLANYYQEISKINTNYHLIKNTEWGAIAYLSHSKYGLCQNNKCENITPNDTMISGKKELDTTTRNIYGVFDMSGNASEFTMASYAAGDNTIDLSTFTNIPISNNDYDLYHENAFILGDATKETSAWTNQDNITQKDWIIRGNNSIFNYSNNTTDPSETTTTRITIK